MYVLVCHGLLFFDYEDRTFNRMLCLSVGPDCVGNKKGLADFVVLGSYSLDIISPCDLPHLQDTIRLNFILLLLTPSVRKYLS